MKKKLLLLSAISALTFCTLTGCTLTDKSPIINEESSGVETSTVTDSEQVKPEISEEEKNDYEKKIAELEEENKDLKDQVIDLEYELKVEGYKDKYNLDENNSNTNNTENTTESSTQQTTEDTEDTVDHRYDGLAVANCHSVILPKGTSYNAAIDEIVKGTTAYPDTFPVIDNVDFNTPGVYTCTWVQKQTDGTYLPLNYAVFTVTITE